MNGDPMEVRLRRRSPAEQLRYWAEVLMSEPTPAQVTAAAMGISMVADEISPPH